MSVPKSSSSDRDPQAQIQALEQLIMRADSLLSLLWHRHVPPDRKDTQLRYDVEQTIGELRKVAK